MDWPPAGSEHHFSEDWRFVKDSARSVKGYDTHNGLHDYSYVPVENEAHSPTMKSRTVHTVSTGRSRKASLTKTSTKIENTAKNEHTAKPESVAAQSSMESNTGQEAPNDPLIQRPFYAPNPTISPHGFIHIQAYYDPFSCYQAYPMQPQQNYYYPWLPPPLPLNGYGPPPYLPQNYHPYPHDVLHPPPSTVIMAPSAAKASEAPGKKRGAFAKKSPKSAKPSHQAPSAKVASSRAPSAKAPSVTGSAKESAVATATAPTGSNRHIYVPVKDDAAKVDVKAWVGRTKKQVDEDNMRIAKAEDAYRRCKVQPIGVSDQQLFWVVDADGTNTIRTFGDIKGLKGEWQPDPRFSCAWFFQRQKEGKK